MADTQEFQQILREHIARYPLMCPQDYGKLAYQNECGPEHILCDKETFSLSLQDEWEAALEDGLPRHPEKIGNNLCRFHLTKTGDFDTAVSLLTQLCVLTAQKEAGTASGLAKNLACLEALNIPGMADWLAEYRRQGYPAVHHSSAYRKAYHPHYRLLRTDYAGYFQILLQIGKLAQAGHAAIISIDRRCGSGKTRLAELIHELFPCNIVHMDDYAEGLFDKGIVQSGATETMGVVFNSQEASTTLTENILDILGITAENIEDIQTVPVDELQAAATQALQQTGQELQLPAALGGGYSMDWEPVVDGDFLPTDPVTEDSFAEAGRDVPLLIGSNLNEWSGFFSADPIEETPELEAALQAAYPNKPGLTADQVDSTTIRLPLLKIMSHKADQGGAPVYAYMFTYGNSYHTAEIPYVFDNLEAVFISVSRVYEYERF